MPIISAIGRRHWRVKALFAGMYLVLLAGAASMVYPFLLMLSGSAYSAVDSRLFTALPRFLYRDDWLYRKFVEGLLNEDLRTENMIYDEPLVTFERLALPADVNPRRAAAWREFIATQPTPGYAWMAGFLMTPVSRTIPQHLRGLKRHWQQTYGPDIRQMNAALGTHFAGWNVVTFTLRSCLLRRDHPDDSAFLRSVTAFLRTLPLEHRYYASVEGFFKRQFLQPQYSGDIAAYNRSHGTRHASWAHVRLARTAADTATPQERNDWETFVRETVALVWVRAGPAALPVYRAYLQRKYRTIEALNRYYGTAYTAFEGVPLVGEPVTRGVIVGDWDQFINGWKDPEDGALFRAPLESLRIHSVEFAFRDWLAERYGGLDGINRALGTAYPSLAAIGLPQRDLHTAWFQDNRSALKREFLARNYLAVAEYILLHGRGVLNTAIYCGLAVLCALLVNPLAAYALSRFKMPATYKVLLFLMATMAFPPMVTGIQNFLILKRVGLLNTFAALILPGLANGYSIFLLKGFFDSQPRELYESASLDGASEWTLFWQIAMSLSKPILAVIALNAFTHAYANFMFAFITCQDERMWTLMVWLYQLQQTSGLGVKYAALILAAIPTLIVFSFCQNIIMRGIVVPSEK